MTQAQRTYVQMVLAAIILIMSSYVLIGCAEPIVESGYVREKKFEPAHWEGGWEEDCGYDYNWSSGKYEYDCDSYWESHHTMVPDRWKLKLEECLPPAEGETKQRCRTGWRWVDETEYHKYAVGGHYPDAR